MLRFLTVLLLGALLGAAGCTLNTDFAYAPAEPIAAAPAPLHVAVLPLADDRAEKHLPGGMGRMFLTYVPFLPYVSMRYERLDEYRRDAKRLDREPLGPGDAPFPELFARAMADDLRASRLFERVTYAPSGTPPADADLVLSGTLTSSRFDWTVTSYMLGPVGVLLWILPIPMARQTAYVDADLELRDRAGAVVWSHALAGRGRRTFTMWNSGGDGIASRARLEIKRYGGNDLGIPPASFWAYHAEALRTGMAGAKASLLAWRVHATPQQPWNPRGTASNRTESQD